MKKYSFLFLLGTFLLSNCSNEQVPSSSLISYTDSLFQASIDSAQIAGGAILVYQNGQMLLDKHYGYASLELSTSMPDEAHFEIGSVTKQFTAAAILKLVEAGKLSLDDDFTQYLDYDTKGRKVTIQQLLDHTSGIASYTEIQEFGGLAVESHPRDSLVRLVESKDFLFEPGEALIYNNSAYFFLGLIIEKLTEQPYEEYLTETFFEPLGMDNTYYCSNSKVIKNKAYGYGFSPDGLRQKQYLNHIWPYAAGSLCSTTKDLFTWMQALHTGKVLNPELYQQLISPAQLNDGTPIRYAKGLSHYSNFGHEEISHGGGIPGFLSMVKYFPEEDLYIICLVNTVGPRGGGYFANLVTWKLLEKTSPETVDIDIDLEPLSGSYRGQVRGQILTVEVKALADALEILAEGEEEADTLDTYIGNGLWMDGNSIITFKDNAYRYDGVSAYYILKKTK